MKRLIAMLMVLCMMIPASSGMASSLFALPVVSEVEEALSYGATFGVKPSSESSLADGSTKQVYVQVQDQDFLSFGVKLAESGYIAENQQTVDGVAETTVVKGDIRFTVGYDQKNHTLSVIYPSGVRIKQMKLANPFEEQERSGELIRVEAGETFQIPGICKLTVKGFYPDEYIKVYDVWATGRKHFEGATNSRIEVEVQNISNQSWYADIYLDVTLHYVNEDGHYSFENDYDLTGHFSNGEIKKTSGALVPLFKSNYTFGFASVPETVRTSTDGYLAVTFSVSSSDKQYIIYFREP